MARTQISAGSRVSDDEALQLARWAVAIETHYGVPMDIEWAKDGRSNELFIVQARPETVHARAQTTALVAHEHGRRVGLCGQAPSDHPEFASFLASIGIDSISVTPDALAAVVKTLARDHANAAGEALPRAADARARAAR